MRKVLTLPLAAAGCTALALLGAQNALAMEGGVSPFPAGSTSEYIAAMPPIAGLFAVQQTSYTSSEQLNDAHGDKLPVPFKMTARSTTTRLLASWGTQLAGASLYSQLVLPLVSLDLSVAGHAGSDKGLSNVTVSPLIARWGLSPESNVTAGLDIALRSGSYRADRMANVAVGYTSWQPILAYRYKQSEGLDVGISNRLLLNQRNGDTGYRSGNAYVGEFTLGWNSERWKVGAVGSYVNQFSDDRLGGTSVGNRMRSFAIGPSIAYNAGPFMVNVNYQRGLYAANTSKSNAIWVNVAIPLWARPGL
nr:transporter [Delftia sp. PS-11]KAJ8745604.1 transporter [Delftia sp. PS-11]